MILAYMYVGPNMEYTAHTAAIAPSSQEVNALSYSACFKNLLYFCVCGVTVMRLLSCVLTKSTTTII